MCEIVWGNAAYLLVDVHRARELPRRAIVLANHLSETECLGKNPTHQTFSAGVRGAGVGALNASVRSVDSMC